MISWLRNVAPGALVCVLILAGATAESVAAQETGYQAGDRAPVVVVNDLDGKPVDLGQYLGQVPVYLEFWATWCSRCEALMPTVRRAAAQFGDEVEFIGVNIAVNQTPRRVRRYLEERHPPFRTLFDNLGTSVRAFHAPTTSYVVIVDREGIIRYTGVGEDQDFDEILRQLTSGGGSVEQ